MKIKIESCSEENTISLGIKIASLLFKESLILLTGDLGAGKTTFTKGIAKGLTESLPDTLFQTGKGLINGGVSFVLGLMIGFYMLFDFNKINDFILDFIPKKHQKN